jgi:hypothetical protein
VGNYRLAAQAMGSRVVLSSTFSFSIIIIVIVITTISSAVKILLRLEHTTLSEGV